MNKTVITIAGSAVGGAAVGSIVTYILTKRRFWGELRLLNEHNQRLMEDNRRLTSLESVSLMSGLISDQATQEPPSEEAAEPSNPIQDDIDNAIAKGLARANRILKEQRYSEMVESLEEVRNEDEYEESSEEVEVYSIFDQAVEVDADGNVIEEEPIDVSKPYVISSEEYSHDEPEFDKITISYYEEDDTLCDDRERPIDDIEGLIGDALSHFGEKSNDRNIVYVRNHRISSDFEVLRETGEYAVRVLGLEKEPKPRLKKMRDDD